MLLSLSMQHNTERLAAVSRPPLPAIFEGAVELGRFWR